MKQKLLMLLALLGVIAIFGVSLQAKEMIYEPFDYEIGGLNGQGGTSDFGFDGVWTAKDIAKVVAKSLTYGSLPTTGGSIDTDQKPYNQFGGARTIDPNALNGLLDDGSTLWFSIELGFGTGTPENGINVTNAQLAFALANNSFSTGNYDYWIQDDGAQLGSGVGVVLGRLNINGSNVNGRTVATQFRNLASGDGKDGYVLGDFSGTTYGEGEHGLIVGKIMWGASKDTIEIYQPDESMNLGDPISSLTVDVDQSTFDTITFCKGDRAAFDEIRFGGYSWDVLGTGDPMKPSPGDGETVLAANPLTLSWTNIPNDSNSVYVDVWFGTEPNELNPAYDMTKIVVEAMDVASTTVDASVEGTYYWRVDSYLDGDPAIITYNNADPNDPNMIEGRLWSFIASSDTAPTVEMITSDQMTWSGGPVPLVADITNLGASATIIEWVVDADSSDDVTLVDGDTATPTVTITKLPYSMAKIANAGFEDDQQVAEDGWGGAPGWTAIGRMGNWNPPVDAYDGSAVPEGIMCAWAESRGNGLAQVLTETLAADTDYTLTVEVGNSNRYDWTGYKVQLLAGGTVIAEDDNTVSPAPGAFATSTVNYSYAPEDANKVGLPLEIRLIAGDLVPEGTYAECNFDDVKLSADPMFPVSTGVETVKLTVYVSDAANPTPVTASVEIDVYDDACAMARVGQGLDDLTDLNKDCIVDNDDLAFISATWLDDKSLDAAAVSPDQAEKPIVINGDFAMYNSETGSRSVAPLNGQIWVNGIGLDQPITGNGPVPFADGTTAINGELVDVPGWISPVESPNGAGLTANVQLWSTGFDTDGTSCLNAFGAWSGQNGNLAKSDMPLDLPVRGPGASYTLKGLVHGDPQPRTFDLYVDGVKIEPDSAIDPPISQTYQEISRTYNSIPVGDARILVGTTKPGEGDPALTGSRIRFDNISLDVVVDGNLPSVYAGENMITWTDESVTLSSTVTANATPITEGSLSYLWTAYPEDGVTIVGADTETPTVTITKPAGDMVSVRLTLTVAIDGVPGVVCDSVTIDVYDTGCLARLASDPELDYDLGDLNGNCITNLEDFGILATSWLVDYSSTGPADQPLEE